MNRCLVIETSGRGGVVCLTQAEEGGDAELLASRVHRGTNAEALFGLFDLILSEAELDRGDLTRVAVIRGPGSFTGLRVGIMVGKALAFGLGIELWAAPTLELLREAASAPLAAVGAGRGFVFSESESGSPRRLGAQSLAGLDAARVAFAERDDVAEEVLGEAGCHGVPVDLARALGFRAAAGRLPARRHDPSALTPLYLAPSQAERVHGVDLSDEVHTPAPPESWREWSQ